MICYIYHYSIEVKRNSRQVSEIVLGVQLIEYLGYDWQSSKVLETLSGII